MLSCGAALFARFWVVDGGGFEPPKAELADLQSAPFGHSGTRPQIYDFFAELLSGAGEGT